jgi:uncharacterized membrane protein YphA (DoxX/SURF4 family)
MAWLEYKKCSDDLYVFFRVVVGLFFFLFGIQKFFGLWGMPGGPATFGSFVWFAAAGEFLIGLGLIVGGFVRLASLFGIVEMLVAFIVVANMSGTWNPMANQGTSALMFALAFVVIYIHGAKKCSLEKKLFKKEYF